MHITSGFSWIVKNNNCFPQAVVTVETVSSRSPGEIGCPSSPLVHIAHGRLFMRQKYTTQLLLSTKTFIPYKKHSLRDFSTVFSPNGKTIIWDDPQYKNYAVLSAKHIQWGAESMYPRFSLFFHCTDTENTDIEHRHNRFYDFLWSLFSTLTT